MKGRLAIASHKKRIDSFLVRTSGIQVEPEILADLAKYFCILTAGYIEKSFAEIVLEHARRQGSPSLQKFIEGHTKKFSNANSEKILQLLGSFDSRWRIEMECILIDEYKAAVDSVYGLRNSIAHGISVGLTFTQMKIYYSHVKEIIDVAQDLCLPEAAA